MPKYLSGRTKKTPNNRLSLDRYDYLSIGEAEPNPGDPKSLGISEGATGPVIPGDTIPGGVKYQLISVWNDSKPGTRYWQPVGGGLIPGSVTFYKNDAQVSGTSSITQLDWYGIGVTFGPELSGSSSTDIRAKIFIAPPGNNGELLFNANNANYGGSGVGRTDFSTSSDLIFNSTTGILTVGSGIHVGNSIVGFGSIFNAVGVGTSVMVGVGITNPTQNLHVAGNLRLTGTIYDSDNNGGIAGDLLIATGNQVEWQAPNQVKSGAGGTISNIQYHDDNGYVDGAPNFVWVEPAEGEEGKVGIGSTQPTALLDVLGNSIFTGITTVGFITASNVWVSGATTVGFVTATDIWVSGAVTANSAKIEDLSDKGVVFTETGGELQTSSNITYTTTDGLNVTGLITSTDLAASSNLLIAGIGTIGNTKISFAKIESTSGNLQLTSSGGTIQVNDILSVKDTTESVNFDSGALQIDGGVGINKRLNVGGATSIAGYPTLFDNGLRTKSYDYQYSSTDNPGKGEVYFVQSNLANLTQISIGITDSGNTDISDIFDTLKTNDIVKIINDSDDDKYISCKLTGIPSPVVGSGFTYNINVTHIGHNWDVISNTDNVDIEITRKGEDSVYLASFGGITTTGGDLYIGGDLFVQDDIFLDEALVQHLFVNPGIATFVGDVHALSNVGIGTINPESIIEVQSKNTTAWPFETEEYINPYSWEAYSQELKLRNTASGDANPNTFTGILFEPGMVAKPQTISSPSTGGSGYSSDTNVTTSGGSGSGLTVDITVNGSGVVQTVTINTPGSGYGEGDEITINDNTEGETDAKFTITAINRQISVARIGAVKSGTYKADIIFGTRTAQIGGTGNQNPFGERMRITATGEVLVGHASTVGAGILQVSTNDEEGIDINGYSTTASDSGRLTFYRSKNADIGTNTLVEDGDSLGRIDFRGYNSFEDGAYDIGATIEALVGDREVYTSNDMPSHLVFKTSQNDSATPTERLRITSDGNVGIGTTNPTNADSGAYNLVVEGGNNTGLSIISGGASATGSRIYFGRGYGGSDNRKGQINYLHSGGDADAFTFHNATTETLRITSGGQISINNTSPKQWNTSYRTLQIHDGGYIAGSTDDSFVAIGANNYLDNEYKYINADFASQLYQVNGELIFRNAASGTADNAITWSERLRIDSTGDIGIGINAPKSIVDIVKASTTPWPFHNSVTGNYAHGPYPHELTLTNSESGADGYNDDIFTGIFFEPGRSNIPTNASTPEVTVAGSGYLAGTTSNATTSGGSGDGLNVNITTNSGGAVIGVQVNTTLPGSGYEIGDEITINGNSGVGASDAKFTLSSVNQQISAARIGAIKSGAYKSDIVFGTRDFVSAGNAPFSERVRITADGHVGIGTTHPTATDINNYLSENNSILAVGIVTANNFYATGDFIGNIVGGITATGDIKIPQWVLHKDDTDTKFGFPDENIFAVETANTERLRIDSYGNIGIGTTNPTDISSTFKGIQVNNSGYIWGQDNGAYPSLFLTNNARPTSGSFVNDWYRDLAGEEGDNKFTAPVQLELYNGDFTIRTADSGPAGIVGVAGTIYWDTRFTVKKEGDVKIYHNEADTAGITTILTLHTHRNDMVQGGSLAGGAIRFFNSDNNYNSEAFIQANCPQVYKDGVPHELSDLSGGSGYSSGTNVPTTRIGGGSGFGLTVDTTVNGSGAVTGVTINTPGSGYRWNDQVSIDGNTEGATDATFIIDTLKWEEEREKTLDFNFVQQDAGTEKTTLTIKGENSLVGIGTTLPFTRLHVYHPTHDDLARFESGDSYAYISFRDGGTDAIDDNNKPTKVPKIGSHGDDFFITTFGVEKLRVEKDGHVIPGADESYDLGSNPSVNSGKRWRKLWAQDIDITGDITVTGDFTVDDLYVAGISTFVGTSYFQSNVGIGTTIPGALLNVYGSTAEIRLQHEGNSSYSRLISDSNNQLNIYTGSGPHLAMTIDGSQNVGIGTDNPTTQLQVGTATTGRLNFDGPDSILTVTGVGAARIDLVADQGTTTADTWRIASTTNNDLKIQRSSSHTDTLVIKQNGDVGIGTDQSDAKLQVYEESSGTTAFLVKGSEGQLFSVTNNLSSGSIFSVNDITGVASIDVNVNGNILLAAYDSGKTGIGTDDPEEKLHVVGKIKADEFLGTVIGDAETASDLSINATQELVIQIANNSTSTLGNGDANQILTSGGSNAAPSWETDFQGNAASATYADNAGIATYADNAGIATYATNAGIATNIKGGGIGSLPYQTGSNTTTFLSFSTGKYLKSGTSAPEWVDLPTSIDYADSAGYADNAGIATYADNAGIATYAGTAGIATNAQGLTGSPDIIVGTIVGAALSISGIGTITDTLKVGTAITAHAGIITAITIDATNININPTDETEASGTGTLEKASGTKNGTNIEVLDTYPSGSYSCSEYMLFFKNASNNIQSQKIIIMDDDNTNNIYYNEYAIMYSDDAFMTVSADYDDSKVRLKAQSSTAGDWTYSWVRILL